jgi:lysozyme family protein
MTDFGPALARLLPFEGGFSNNSNDSGGETYRGISRKNFPNWRGWNRIDQCKGLPNWPKNIEQFWQGELRQLVEQFYRSEFWRPEYEMLSQDVANKVFDIAVNAGARVAVKLLQRAARAARGMEIDDDGSWGPNTEAAIAGCNQTCLLIALRSEQAGLYREIIARNPSQEVFRGGWTKRAYA